MKNIALLGYMASGKTTIAKLLAEKLGQKYFDLDQIIEQDEKLSVNEIFESKGEIYFRKREHQILKSVLSTNDNSILALGGGTPCYAGNMDICKNSDWKTVYLRASIDTLVNRLQQNKTRPLVRDKSPEELQNFVAMHLFERSFYYNQADVIISTDNKSPEEIVDLVIASLT